MRKLSYLFMALCTAMLLPCRRSRRAGKRRAALTGWPSPLDFPWRLRSRLVRTGPGAKPRLLPPKALARNPAARPGIQLALILGLALIESLALYTLVIIFVKVK